MIEILDQMKEMIDPALANGCPCILATVSGDGTGHRLQGQHDGI